MPVGGELHTPGTRKAFRDGQCLHLPLLISIYSCNWSGLWLIVLPMVIGRCKVCSMTGRVSPSAGRYR